MVINKNTKLCKDLCNDNKAWVKYITQMYTFIINTLKQHPSLFFSHLSSRGIKPEANITTTTKINIRETK